ncbi:hypothetical protein [Leptolyngbya sp. FACHB-16]|uniref:hypothetical protein n=1 Tax=unclassified Leptolyngbya TaxID=2650499 RepID=UPI001689CA24|nr:hypothetical protein [Leptolyngbya sp. FACHB-16]MBD2153088.1 hypothetical protein [Leptolyngbya sp. FACHB-16]
MPTPHTVPMLSTNPKGIMSLCLNEELHEVKEGLIKHAKLRENFTLVSEHAVRTRDVHSALIDYQPHILHFLGHGAGNTGSILENESGASQEVIGEAIAPLFLQSNRAMREKTQAPLPILGKTQNLKLKTSQN